MDQNTPIPAPQNLPAQSQPVQPATTSDGVLPAAVLPDQMMPGAPAVQAPASPAPTEVTSVQEVEGVAEVPAFQQQTPIVTPEMETLETTDKLIATFSYLAALFVIPMFARPRSKLCQYHARQGMVLFLCWLALQILSITTRFVHPALAGMVYSVEGLGLIILMAIGITNVWREQLKPLPIVGMLPEMFSKKLKKQAPPTQPAAPVPPKQ